MAIKDTCKKMTVLLEEIQKDLPKAEGGNKAAAQRVRTNSIKLEKVAKLYRKESVKAGKAKKRGATTKKRTTKKKVTPKKVVKKAVKTVKKAIPTTKKRKTTTRRRKKR